MIKILFNEKRIFLVEDYPEIINTLSIKNAHIIFSVNREKLRTGIDILMISEIDTLLVVGKEQESLQIFRDTFKYVRAGGGIVQNNGAEYLLIYRRGKWDLPKGKLDEGEDMASCAIREVKEETGLEHVEIVKPFKKSYHIYIEEETYFKETEWFLMKANQRSLKPQKEEGIKKAVWVHGNNLKPQLKNTYESIIDIFSMLGIKP